MPKFKEITPFDANSLLESTADVLVLDIRDAQAFQMQHHPRAQSLNEDLLKHIIKRTAKSTPIIVVCYHGNSSKEIAQLFCDFGFSACYSLQGGYDAWQTQHPTDLTPINSLTGFSLTFEG